MPVFDLMKSTRTILIDKIKTKVRVWFVVFLDQKVEDEETQKSQGKKQVCNPNFKVETI